MNKEQTIFDFNESSDGDDDISGDVSLQISSTTIKINYYQLLKWSTFVRENYSIKQMNQLSEYIQQCQQKYNIKTENIKSFFKYLMDEQAQTTIDQYCDHRKLSKILGVSKYERILKKYSDNHCGDVDFILNLLKEQLTLPNMEDIIGEISSGMEDILSNNLEQCFKNQNFEELPITQIYRIIEKSGEEINSNFLYNFIKKSFETRYIFLQFIKVQKLSSQNFFELCDKLLKNEDSIKKRYVEYLAIDLNYVKELKEEKNKLQIQIDEMKKKSDTNSNLEAKILKLKDSKKKLILKNIDLQQENDKLKEEIAQLKGQTLKSNQNSIKKNKNESPYGYENDNRSKLLKILMEEEEEEEEEINDKQKNIKVLAPVNDRISWPEISQNLGKQKPYDDSKVASKIPMDLRSSHQNQQIKKSQKGKQYNKNDFHPKNEVIIEKPTKKTSWVELNLGKQKPYDDSKDAKNIPIELRKSHKAPIIQRVKPPKENAEIPSKFEDEFTDN